MKKYLVKSGWMRLIRVFSGVCLGLYFSTDVAGQGVAGKVIDAVGQPLEFANVVLLSETDSTFIGGTVSQRDGTFRFCPAKQERYLLKASSIGYIPVCKSCETGDSVILRLNDDAVILKETVVVGKLPTHQLKDGALVTQVQSSLLSKAGTGNDVLRHIPGVLEKEGEYTVFGKGVPVIYIDGRLLRDVSELDRISSSDIRQVEVITNPGARYDASVKAVIRIKTVKKEGDGMGVDVRSALSQWEHTDLAEQLNLNYRHRSFDLFGSLQYSENKWIHRGDLEQFVFVDTLWTQQNRVKEVMQKKSLDVTLGMNYLMNDRHSVGVRYQMNATPRNKKLSFTQSDVFADGQFYDTWLGNGNSITDESPSHRLNVYYNGAWGKLDIDFNADLFFHQIGTVNRVFETSSEFQDREVTSCNNVDNNLYAAKLVLSHPLAGGSFSFGTEYTATRRTDRFDNPQQILPSADSRIEEKNASLFAEYGRMVKFAYLSAGLRYEHVTFDYFERGGRIDGQSRNFDNFYPSLSLATRVGGVQAQLNYKVKTLRPTFYQLRSNMDYVNRYTYQNGNPSLKPELTHDVTLSGAYKWLQFMVSYQRKRDVIMYVADQDIENPAITIVTHRNFDKIDNLSAFLVAAPTIGRWTPQCTVGVSKQWANIAYNGTVLKMDTPMLFASIKNGIELFAGWGLSLDLSCQGKGDYQNVTLTRTQLVVNAGITKSFLNDKFSVNLQGLDLSHGQKDGNLLYNKQMHLDLVNSYSSRKIRLTLRYKFNSTKSKYKGEGAGQEAIRRM